MFKLIEENNNIKIYKGEHYDIREKKYSDGTITLNIIKKNNNSFVPKIYIVENIRADKLEKFEIQTTSYGSLESKDIEKIIEGYKIFRRKIFINKGGTHAEFRRM